jgi:hypothetical protein
MMQDDLELLFATTKQSTPGPSAALIARVLSDAHQEQSLLAQIQHFPPVVAPVRPRFLPLWLDVFGGGGALAGMSAAMIAGFYLGFAQPSPVDTLTYRLWPSQSLETMDMMPGIDALLVEE